MTDQHVLQARQNDPEGILCSYCGEDNDFADDIGWFHIAPNIGKSPLPKFDGPDQGYCCWKCWRGPPGQAHVKRYGLGDR